MNSYQNLSAAFRAALCNSVASVRAAIQPPLPRHVVGELLALLLITRGLLMLVALVGPSLVQLPPNPYAWAGSSQSWINVWARWDTEWYISIAEHGYQYQPGRQSNVAFSPAFPVAMKIVAVLVGHDDAEGWLIAGIIVANAALLAAIVYLFKLVILDTDAPVAWRTLFYLLIFPTSFFLSSVYPESLFLALTVAAFYYARLDKWWPAGILGGLAALTRSYGVVLFVPLVVEYTLQHHFDRRPMADHRIVAIALIPVAFLGWCSYMYFLFGDPWLASHAMAAWGRGLTTPWQTLQAFFSAPLELGSERHSPIDLGFTIAFGGLAVMCIGRVRHSYALFAVLLYLVMLSSGVLFSLMRYVLELFPCFMTLALLGQRRTWVHRVYLVVACALSVVFITLYAAGYRVA